MSTTHVAKDWRSLFCRMTTQRKVMRIPSLATPLTIPSVPKQNTPERSRRIFDVMIRSPNYQPVCHIYFLCPSMFIASNPAGTSIPARTSYKLRSEQLLFSQYTAPCEHDLHEPCRQYSSKISRDVLFPGHDLPCKRLLNL